MAEKTMTMQGMCESLYQTATAMTTSIEIAEKVAEEVNEEIEGLDALSAYIEKVLARVKITLLDTVLRVESEKGDTKIELRKVLFYVLNGVPVVFRPNFENNNVGCVFPRIVVSILYHAELSPNEMTIRKAHLIVGLLKFKGIFPSSF